MTLKPCPFCGNEAHILTDSDNTVIIGYHVECMACHSSGQLKDSKANAAMQWNTRPTKRYKIA